MTLMHDRRDRPRCGRAQTILVIFSLLLVAAPALPRPALAGDIPTETWTSGTPAPSGSSGPAVVTTVVSEPGA